MTLSQSKLALLTCAIVALAASVGDARAEDPHVNLFRFGFLSEYKPSKPASDLARADNENQPPELLPAPRCEGDAKCCASEKCQATGCPAIIVINNTPSLLQVVGEWLFSYFFMGDEDEGPEPPVAPAPAFVEGCQMRSPLDYWPMEPQPVADAYPRNSSESLSMFMVSLPYMMLPGTAVQSAIPTPERGPKASADLPMTMPYIITSYPFPHGAPNSAPSTTRLLSGAEIATLPPPVPVFAPFGRLEQPSYVAEPPPPAHVPESLPPQLPMVSWSPNANVSYPNQGLIYQAVATLPAPVNPSRAPCLMKAERDGDQFVVAAQRGGMSMLCTKVTLEMSQECRLQVGAANRRIVLATKEFEAVADMVEAQEEEGRLVLIGRATLLYKKNGEPCRVEADKIMLDVTKAGLDFRATSAGR